MEASEYRVEEYKPGIFLLALYWISVVSLVGVGFVIMFRQAPSENFGLVGWPWFAFLIAVGVVGPPAIQRLAIKRFGLRTSRRTWGAASPYLTYWWRVEEQTLTKRQFATIYGLPAAFLCAVAVVYAALYPGAFVIIGFVLFEAAGSLFFSAMALAKPEGTLVEEIESGVRFRHPAP